ncbi:MAG: carboxylesterase family protein, partial [Synergistaceae bacterium]|nr:carboxylesterase family protein [Synergistaceae bacterium]
NYFMSIVGGSETFVEETNKRLAKYITQLTDTERAKLNSFISDDKFAGAESYEPWRSLYNQIWFIAPLFRLSENQAKSGGKSYTYYFTPESSIPDMKCCHAMELSTVLNNPENTIYTGRVLDETFAKTMRKMWIQFARTGDPSLSAENSPDGKAHNWPLYNPDDKELMVFDEFNIHTAKEAELKIVDWDRMYFITKYYLF